MAYLALGDELAAWLVTHVVAPVLTAGTNLFVGTMQDVPALQAVLVVRSAGPPPVVLDAGAGPPQAIKVEEQALQVMVRSDTTDYLGGEAMIHAIYGQLHGLGEVSLGTGLLVVKSCWALQSPTYLGRDEKQRHLWSQNFRVFWENANR